MTEEMEEGENSTLYDDYRFVTRAELERIGLNLPKQKIWALAEQLEQNSTASLSLESQK
jgi:hypothetical protein